MTWLDTQPPPKVAEAMERFRADTSGIGESARRYGGDDERFQLWLWLVDRKTIRLTGMSIFDLCDGPWRDYYDDELSPSAALRTFIDDGYDDVLARALGGGE